MNNCFVYGFFDPRENFKEFFYIGKGKNDRLKSLSRNHFVNERIKEIRNSGSNVEIILFEENLTDDEAFELEKKLIKLYGRKIFNEGSLLNIMPGGEGIIGFCGELNGFYNKKHTPETRKLISEKIRKIYQDPNSFYHTQEYKDKMRIATTGELNGFYNKTHTPETRRIVGDKIKERWKEGVYDHIVYPEHLSEEHKRKISETLKGKMSGENNPMFGYEFSEEQLLKKSEISKNLWKDEEFRKKNIASRTGLKRTKETCENISKGNKGKNKGKKFMVKDGVIRSVKPEDFEEFLKNGYSFGRK